MDSKATTLRRAALAALLASEPAGKCVATLAISQELPAGASEPLDAPWEPGRPAAPDLVAPRQLKQRSLATQAGRTALIHAVAHIEFNAINLALDAMVRFPDLPREFYFDWLSVAIDEARHFQMLCGRLAELDAAYGDLPAHNGLWEMAQKTAHDPLVRMALVPRVLEARGLDVSPGMITRLEESGDTKTADILRVILSEEERHVQIGSHWFNWFCAARGLEPQAKFLALVDQYLQGGIRPPINREARMRAGFGSQELERIENLSKSGRA